MYLEQHFLPTSKKFIYTLKRIYFSLFRDSTFLLVARWLTIKLASQTAFWELVAYKQVAYKKCTLTFASDCRSYTTYLHFDYLSNSFLKFVKFYIWHKLLKGFNPFDWNVFWSLWFFELFRNYLFSR